MDVFEARQGKIFENFASETTGAAASVSKQTYNTADCPYMTRILALSRREIVSSPSVASASVNGPFRVRKLSKYRLRTSEFKIGFEEAKKTHQRSLDSLTPFGMRATSTVAILKMQTKLFVGEITVIRAPRGGC
jgi:hypothetical protein